MIGAKSQLSEVVMKGVVPKLLGRDCIDVPAVTPFALQIPKNALTRSPRAGGPEGG